VSGTVIYASKGTLKAQGAKAVMHKPSRIVFLITGLYHGGAEIQLVRLATLLTERGYCTTVISLLALGRHASELQRAGVEVESLEMTKGLGALSALARAIRLVRELRPDALVSFLFHANVLGRLVGRVTSIPVVISSIRNERFGGAWRERAIRATDFLADAVVVNSRAVGESLVRRRITSASHLQVVPNGIRVDEYIPNEQSRVTTRSQLGVAPDEFLWVAVGRLTPQKDYHTLLHAFRYALDVRPKARLRIAGEGPLLGELNRLRCVQGLRGKCSFLSLRHDIPELLAAADALVLSSAWEGLPNVLMEAGAAEKPVVATDVGGVREIVVDGESGFVVSPGDPTELGMAMVRMMELSQDDRGRMGQRGHSHVARAFDLPCAVERWERVLHAVFERKGVRM